MKCPRCQKDMLSTGDGDFQICFTDGCPISKYESENGYYVFTLTFEKFPGIYIETGLNKKGEFTYISQVSDENIHFFEDKVIREFEKEMVDMTVDRLQTILVFG